MFNLKTEVEKVVQNKKAIGHFNIANLEMLQAVLLAGQTLSKDRGEQIPLIIGLSEGERKFVGSRQAVAFIKSWREEHNYPVFVNADHCHSFESAKEAGEAGFDAVVIDNSSLSFEENVEATRKAVTYLRGNFPEIILEGELGVIGKHSALLEKVPEEVKIGEEQLTTVAQAVGFVEETKVDCLAPAVGNIHGMLKNSFNPDLDIERIKEIKEVLETPLILHGGSGLRNEEIRKAVLAGMVVVHISTELRKAYSVAVKNLGQDFFVSHPDEVAPYKIMEPVIQKMTEVVKQKLELFS